MFLRKWGAPLALIVLFGLLFILSKQKLGNGNTIGDNERDFSIENQQVIPTKSKEEIEVILQKKQYVVEITAGGISPQNLQIQKDDQVFWENKDEAAHTLSGDMIGEIEIAPQDRYLKTFKEKGTITYTDSVSGITASITVN